MKKFVFALVWLVATNLALADVVTTTTTTTTNDGKTTTVTTPAPKKKKLNLYNTAVRPVYVPEAPRKMAAPEQQQPSKFSGGLEFGLGAFPGVSNVGQISGLGFVGDYSLDQHWGLEGRMDFLSYNISNPYYYGYWSPSGPSWDPDYRFHSGIAGSNANYSQVDLTFGPTYRILTGRWSPILGAMLGYSHRYYNVPAGGSYGQYGSPYYGTSGYSGNSDTLSLGGLVGIEYDITKEMSIGADIRYMVPISYSSGSSGYYYPAGSTPVEGMNYYLGTLNLKFHF